MKRIITYVIFISLITINYANAHKLIVFAWMENDIVFTQSKFIGGKKVYNSKIEIYNDSNKKIFEGTTDETGFFSFKLKEKLPIKIVSNAGSGHRGEWVIKKKNDIKSNNKELEQIFMLISKMEERIYIRDIIGGIGYIIGFLGLIAYFHYRKKSSCKK